MDGQERHFKVVKALSALDIYRTEQGENIFQYKENKVSAYDPNSFDRQSLDNAVALLADTLNLTGASVDNVNLYRLLRTYLLNPQKRIEINKHLEF